MSISRLAKFTSCEISDALVRLGVTNGGFIPDIQSYSPTTSPEKPICGPAYTVQMVPYTDTTSPRLSAHFIDTAPEGFIIVIDTLKDAKSAVFGGMMTAGAQARGAIGVVISGRCRDLAEHRESKFPVFARGLSTLGQTPFTRPSAVNCTLNIRPQGEGASSFPPVEVHPGDFMIADLDGVVCVPQGMEEKVAEMAAKGREEDANCIADIRAGKGVAASYKMHRSK